MFVVISYRYTLYRPAYPHRYYVGHHPRRVFTIYMTRFGCYVLDGLLVMFTAVGLYYAFCGSGHRRSAAALRITHLRSYYCPVAYDVLAAFTLPARNTTHGYILPSPTHTFGRVPTHIPQLHVRLPTPGHSTPHRYRLVPTHTYLTPPRHIYLHGYTTHAAFLHTHVHTTAYPTVRCLPRYGCWFLQFMPDPYGLWVTTTAHTFITVRIAFGYLTVPHTPHTLRGYGSAVYRLVLTYGLHITPRTCRSLPRFYVRLPRGFTRFTGSRLTPTLLPAVQHTPGFTSHTHTTTAIPHALFSLPRLLHTDIPPRVPFPRLTPHCRTVLPVTCYPHACTCGSTLPPHTATFTDGLPRVTVVPFYHAGTHLRCHTATPAHTYTRYVTARARWLPRTHTRVATTACRYITPLPTHHAPYHTTLRGSLLPFAHPLRAPHTIPTPPHTHWLFYHTLHI